jgi:hypothetical protein
MLVRSDTRSAYIWDVITVTLCPVMSVLWLSSTEVVFELVNPYDVSVRPWQGLLSAILLLSHLSLEQVRTQKL